MSLTRVLIESENGSDFLKRAERALKESDVDFSYAAFAERAGFSARSYVREVFQGKKPLGIKAFAPFAHAFGFKRDERELMRSLFAIQNPDFSPALPLEKARAVIERKKRRADLKSQRRRLSTPIEAPPIGQGVNLERWPVLFAGLGFAHAPAQLAKKLGMKTGDALQALQAMKTAGLVQEAHGLWTVVDRHVLLDPDLHQEMIRGHFQAVLKKSLARSQESFSDPERLHYVSSFGVKKSRLPELKKQLIETLVSFMEDCDDGQEDEIVSLAVSLIRE